MVASSQRDPDQATREGWRPKLVALDIDGTLLRWVTDTGAAEEEVPQSVRDAVNRAYDAGAEIVLASGRSQHGMTTMREDGERWLQQGVTTPAELLRVTKD